MPEPPRIYLDNAATSWPKPPGVAQAASEYLRDLGAPAGRGSYREAVEVDRRLAQVRARLADLLAAPRPQQVLFTAGCTDSLNLAIHGLLKPGDHVVTTVVEHNSVLRPLRFLEQTGGVAVERVECDRSGVIDPSWVAAALRPETRLLVAGMASNVTGAIEPLQDLVALAAARGVLTLVDAAQSLGHHAWRVTDVPADLVAASGHKGLLGPPGVGILYVREGVETQLQSLRQGGTGSQSDRDEQPSWLPDKYEAGTPNIPGILGLGAGVEYLAEQGLDQIRLHELQLIERLLEGLSEIDAVEVYGPPHAAGRVGVVSLNVAGYDPRELAGLLDSHYGIQVRSGIHCAPLMHRALGTLERGGTVRVSVGPFNTLDDIDTLVGALGEAAATAPA